MPFRSLFKLKPRQTEHPLRAPANRFGFKSTPTISVPHMEARLNNPGSSTMTPHSGIPHDALTKDNDGEWRCCHCQSGHTYRIQSGPNPLGMVFCFKCAHRPCDECEFAEEGSVKLYVPITEPLTIPVPALVAVEGMGTELAVGEIPYGIICPICGQSHRAEEVKEVDEFKDSKDSKDGKDGKEGKVRLRQDKKLRFAKSIRNINSIFRKEQQKDDDGTTSKNTEANTPPIPVREFHSSKSRLDKVTGGIKGPVRQAKSMADLRQGFSSLGRGGRGGGLEDLDFGGSTVRVNETYVNKGTQTGVGDPGTVDEGDFDRQNEANKETETVEQSGKGKEPEKEEEVPSIKIRFGGRNCGACKSPLKIESGFCFKLGEEGVDVEALEEERKREEEEKKKKRESLVERGYGEPILTVRGVRHPNPLRSCPVTEEDLAMIHEARGE